jgi:3-hydroxy-9,10-secoandrosta-1,3,5(10)-triene-9,17-dione monooxygenase
MSVSTVTAINRDSPAPAGVIGGAPAHDELVARAEALVPELRARVAEADALRKVPPANIEALRKAGLFRVLQARRYGGHQQSLRTHIDTVAAVAHGCGATAWCMGVIHAHSWLMAHFPQAAQEETFGANPDAIIAAVIAPRGRARAVQDGDKAGDRDGYVLSGVWPFASGSQHADWLFLGAAIVDDKGEVTDEADFLVPSGDVIIKDDWNVTGLRATGSCTVLVKDLFVPTHRYLSMRGLTSGNSPGAGLHEGTLYKSASVPVLTLALAPCALGIARAGFAAFKERLPGRKVAYTEGEVQIDMPVTHVQAAQAATRIDVAEALLYRCADEIEAAAVRGRSMEIVKRARVRADCAWAVRQCLEAVEILYLASGGSGIADSSALGRAWRDLHAVNMHGLLNLETNMELYGRIVLGLQPNTPLI